MMLLMDHILCAKNKRRLKKCERKCSTSKILFFWAYPINVNINYYIIQLSWKNECECECVCKLQSLAIFIEYYCFWKNNVLLNRHVLLWLSYLAYKFWANSNSTNWVSDRGVSTTFSSFICFGMDWLCSRT